MNKIARERNHLFVAAIQHDIHTFVCVSAHIRKVQLNLRHFTWSSKKKQRVKKTRFCAIGRKCQTHFTERRSMRTENEHGNGLFCKRSKWIQNCSEFEWTHLLAQTGYYLLYHYYFTHHTIQSDFKCASTKTIFIERAMMTLYIYLVFFSPFFCLLFCLPQNLSDHIAAKCRVKTTPLACVCVCERA